MKPVKALIIDDEPLARQMVREYLASHPEILVVAECRDAHEALTAIEEYNPDLLFLDIQMPEVNGFELLAMLNEIPHVIFSTAYDAFALQAFEVNAVDYLLKPYVQSRFDMAVERAFRSIHQAHSDVKKIRHLLDYLPEREPVLNRILIRDSGKIVILNACEIIWLEAMEDYVTIHTSDASHLVLQSLGGLESRLDPIKFIRVHRSAIVNLEAVRELVPLSGGRMMCRMTDGTEVAVSRTGAKKLREMMV